MRQLFLPECPLCGERLDLVRTVQEVPDPYEILGVEPTASLEEIKRAYRRAVVAVHPDRPSNRGIWDGNVDPVQRWDFNAQELLRAVVQAMEMLSDPKRRAEYDETRRRAKGEKLH